MSAPSPSTTEGTTMHPMVLEASSPPPPPTKMPSNVSVHSNNNNGNDDGNSVVTVNSSSSSSFDDSICDARGDQKAPTDSPTCVKDAPVVFVDSATSHTNGIVLRAGASTSTCTTTQNFAAALEPAAEGGGRPPRIMGPLQRLRSRARRNLGEEPKENSAQKEEEGGGFHDRRRRRQLERMKVSSSSKKNCKTWSDRLTTAWSGVVAPDVVASKLVDPRETHQGHYGTVLTFASEDAVSGANDQEIPQQEKLERMKVATDATKNKTTWKESWKNIMASLTNPEYPVDSTEDNEEDNEEEVRGNYDYVFCDDMRDDDEKDTRQKTGRNESRAASNTIALSKADAKFIQDLLYTLRSVVRQLRRQVRAMEWALQDADEENQMWKARVRELEAQIMERNEAALIGGGGKHAEDQSDF